MNELETLNQEVPVSSALNEMVEPTKLTFIILGASMAGLSIMILVVSSLATGSTRHEVYRTSSGRTYGRIACIIFIGIIYFLLVCWLIVFACNVIMLMVYSIYWGVCGTPEIKDWRDDGKIDFYQFHFMFPEGTHRSEMEVHGTNEVKQFCKVTNIMNMIGLILPWCKMF